MLPPPDLTRGTDGKTRYRDDEQNIYFRLAVDVDGRRFEAREMIDAAMWEYRFSRDRDGFESFIRWWINSHFGMLANTDQTFYDHLRAKLFIVTPQDAHSTPVCRRSNEQDDAPWPRCFDGAILTAPPEPPVVPGAVIFTRVVRLDTVVGACTCRCHPAYMRRNVVYGLRTSEVDL